LAANADKGQKSSSAKMSGFADLSNRGIVGDCMEQLPGVIAGRKLSFIFNAPNPKALDYSTNLKKLFGAPHIGQSQLSGMSAQRVRGAIPLSGSPLASS